MTATATIPRIGDSATYYIGSDAYHEIIIGVERNGKTIKTYSAEAILQAAGLSLEEWNKLESSSHLYFEFRSENDRFRATRKALRAIFNHHYEYALGWQEGITKATAEANHWLKSHTREFTARTTKNGETYFLLKGEKYGSLVIGSQYSYRDPHF